MNIMKIRFIAEAQNSREYKVSKPLITNSSTNKTPNHNPNRPQPPWTLVHNLPPLPSPNSPQKKRTLQNLLPLPPQIPKTHCRTAM